MCGHLYLSQIGFNPILSPPFLLPAIHFPAPIRMYNAGPWTHPDLAPILTLTQSKRLAQIANPFSPADYSADEADEETNQQLQKEIEEAEKQGHDQGKPGSFLHKLIAHGNKKTEEQLAREAREREQRYESKDGVIR